LEISNGAEIIFENLGKTNGTSWQSLLKEKHRGMHCHGCQIFLGTKYQNGKKATKLPRTAPNFHKI
jgi:hypothetical protein